MAFSDHDMDLPDETAVGAQDTAMPDLDLHPTPMDQLAAVGVQGQDAP